jgi:cysteinyl-tRNA synthetase
MGGQKQAFVPLRPSQATMYSCGPTVYSRAHIGNLRPYVMSDTLARVLAQNGIRVRRVINITDVGHLTGDNEGDANQGEDRMEKSARETGQNASDIADHFTRLFLEDIEALDISPDVILFPRATQYIPEQIAMIQTLEAQGHTYRTHDGIYFDVSTFPGYGKLGNIPQEHLKNGTAATVADRIALSGRGRIKENKEKRNPADFALWKFSPAGVVRQQEWPSPWGRGFPGWHLECSAMSKALLGTELDIHTGGMDHIPVHHNNEIAQSESANQSTFVRYWLHSAFLTIDEERIGKSVGNALYLSDIVERGYHPLALRYFFLQANYRTPLSFSWDALTASNEALSRLWRIAQTAKNDAGGIGVQSEASERIRALAADDLGTPRVIAALWEIVRDEDLSHKKIWGAIETAEEVLGLSLTNPPHAPEVRTPPVPEEIRALAQEREDARAARDFARADELRIHIEESGYAVEDTADGPRIHRK